MNPDYEMWLGFLGASITSLSFLPQAIKVVMTRQTRDISRNMYISFITGICIWSVYAFLRKDYPMLFANTITLILSTVILVYKFKEKQES